jgi:hypothetical protein
LWGGTAARWWRLGPRPDARLFNFNRYRAVFGHEQMIVAVGAVGGSYRVEHGERSGAHHLCLAGRPEKLVPTSRFMAVQHRRFGRVPWPN